MSVPSHLAEAVAAIERAVQESEDAETILALNLIRFDLQAVDRHVGSLA